MLAPIIEEEEGEVEKDFQNKTISEKITSSDIDEDPLEDHNTSEEEDDDVVIVDLGEKVRNVLENFANMIEEEEKQNHSGPEGGSSRQLQGRDDCLKEINDTEIIWCRTKNTDDNEEEMTFSVIKDHVTVESGSESESELYSYNPNLMSNSHKKGHLPNYAIFFLFFKKILLIWILSEK